MIVQTVQNRTKERTKVYKKVPLQAKKGGQMTTTTSKKVYADYEILPNDTTTIEISGFWYAVGWGLWQVTMFVAKYGTITIVIVAKGTADILSLSFRFVSSFLSWTIATMDNETIETKQRQRQRQTRDVRQPRQKTITINQQIIINDK